MRRPLADEDDRVRGDAADQAPGEVEVGRSASVGGRRVATRPRGRIVGGDVGGRDEDAPPGGPQGAGRGMRRRGTEPSEARSIDEDPQVRLRREDLEGLRLVRRGDDDLEEDRARPSRRPRSTSRVRATTPPNALTGSAASAAVPRLRERRPLGGAARVRVLDDDARRARAGAARVPAPPRASRTLLYESALPWSGGAPRAERAVGDGRRPAGGSGPPAGAGSRRTGASRPSRG
jgi:hypothetical protein